MFNFLRQGLAKRSAIRASLTVALIMCIAGTSLALGSGRSHASRHGSARHYRHDLSPTGQEIARLRTANSRSYRNADGTVTKSLFAGAVNYRGRDGNWRPIDSRLVPTLSHVGLDPFSLTTSDYKWQNAANSFDVRFKPQLGRDYMHVDTRGLGIGMTLSAANQATGDLEHGQLVYRGAQPDTDIHYEVLPTGVKESLVLRSRKAPSSYRFVLDTSAGKRVRVTRQPDGSFVFRSGGRQNAVFSLAAPTVNDAGEKVAPATNHGAVHMGVSRVAGGFAVTVKVDRNFLRSPARHFPVTVDPTLTIQPEDYGAYFQTNCAKCAGNLPGYFYVGTDASNVYRTALHFDLSSIPTTATISNATLGLYNQSWICVPASAPCGSSSHQLDLHRMSSTWSPVSKSSALTFDATPLTSYTLPAGAPDGFMTWNVTSTVQSWQNGSQPNYGFLVKRHTEPLNAGGPYIEDATPWEDQPKLDITYGTDAVVLASPNTLHANGADLSWTKWDGSTGASFQRYEVHRSSTANFTPTAANLVATIGDANVTSYRDTTAAPTKTYTYKIVTNSTPSNEQTVTLPADGHATKLLQPGAGVGQDVLLEKDPSNPAGCVNHGADSNLWVGSDYYVDRALFSFDLKDIPAGAHINSATFSAYMKGAPSATMTVGAHRVTSAWKPGTGSATCSGDGATWSNAQPLVPWGSAGGDFESTAKATVTHHSGDVQGWDNFSLTSLVQDWVNASSSNLGLMLKAEDESDVLGKTLNYASSEDITSTQRPKLSLDYNDNSHSQSPVVALSSPASGATVSGTSVNVSASAGDDGQVTQVQFFVDGNSVGTDSTAPYAVTWNSTTVTSGSHAITAKATDDAGNVTTSSGASVTVANSAPPTTKVTSPSQTYQDLVKADSPAAYWRLGETTGTVASDGSGNNRTGTYAGSYTLAQSSLIVGNTDKAVLFNNATTDGKVTAASLTGLLGSTLTAEAWVNYTGVTTANTYDRVLARNWGSAGGWMLGVYKDTGGVQRAHFGINVGGTVYAATAAVTPGKLHLAGTYDGTTVRLYVNGSEVANIAKSAAALSTSTSVLVGETLNDNITIDEPAVYSGVLSAAQLKQHYDVGSGRTPTVKGNATVSADASDDKSVSKVEFYVDGNLFDTDTTAPYTGTLKTLDPVTPVYDGSHVITTKASDADGQVTTSADSDVVVANTSATKYQASFSSTATPQAMTYDPNAGTQQQAGVQVTVTNQGTTALSASDVVLRYRWYSPDPANPNPVVTDGPATSLVADLGPGASKTVTVMVDPPTLPDGVDRAQYKLRFDLYEQSTSTWFADKGNQPLDNPVIVNKALLDNLGLERYWHYQGQDIGAGMQHLVNVSNGNSLLRWTPWDEPGRGLSTVLDLTYNSLEKKSESPIGNNFSLSISSLTRWGNPIDIHPNNADSIAGRANRYIDITDGDGTTHRFTGQQAGDGTVYWQEPAGTHLYLRHYSDTDATKAWAFTRPDRTTFFYDSEGFPTGVEDPNGNRLSYTLENTPSGGDPGGPKKRITKVTDAAGQGASPAPNRSFDITYYSKTDAKKPQVRGKIKQITDHAGSALRFDYYDDGNLLRITQAGGANADGSVLADRSWVFTYTTSAGSGPAIPNGTDRVNPDPKTSDESTRIYSVRDPRGKETTFSYLGSGAGQDRWKLASLTDRLGKQTSFAYDNTNRITTVTEPLSRISKYAYDTDGKVTTITNPNNEVATIEWNSDRAVHKLNEPSGAFTEYLYNDNGYLTDVYDQLRNHTQLTYANSTVDANDASGKWAVGRSIPHISDLATKTNPRGTATASPSDDYQWQFSYDANGNLKQIVDPKDASGNSAHSDFAYNADGTLASAGDENTHTTNYKSYDANGLPAEIDDPAGDITKFNFDDAGRLRWLQDPNHATSTASDPRQYRDYFDYDSFGRLGRQSAPKSTTQDQGNLIWSDAGYDANDNLVKEIAPHFGATDTLNGSVTTHSYDDMDRVTLDTGPDTSADPNGERTAYAYDDAGRLTSLTLPRGVRSTTSDKDFASFLSYDPLDRVTKETRYAVDSGGAITKTLNTHYCYDIAGDLRSITKPRAGVATVTCSPYAGASFTTKLDYDADHRLLAQTDPLGHKRSQTYDPNGNVDTTTDEQNSVGQLSYDQRDRLIKGIQPFDAGRTLTTQYEYDPAGNLKRLISPRAYDASSDKSTFVDYVTSFTYDPADRLTRTDLPKNSTTTQTYQLKGYDPNGNLAMTSLPVTDSDPNHLTADQKTTLTYFDPGWIRTANDPSDPTNRYDYRAEGWQTLRTVQTTGIDDPNRTSSWDYYPDGMLKSEGSPDHQVTSYAYDEDNNLTSADSSRGVGSSTEAPVHITASYDGFDRLASTRDQKTGDSQWHVSTLGYDDDNNLTQTVNNAIEGSSSQTGRENDYSYDPADWLSDQTDHGNDNSSSSDDRHLTFSFLPTGWQQNRTVQKAGATKETTDWTYFLNGQLKTLTTKNGAGSTMESHNVSYIDAGIYLNGNRAQDVYTLKGPGGGPCATSCTAKYTYDGLDRVTHEHTDRGDSTNLDIDYTLDPAGNVTKQIQNGTTAQYRYIGQRLDQQLDAGGSVTGRYFYDTHGNLQCITTAAGSRAACDTAGGSAPDPSLVSSNTYDPLDRLTTYHSYTAGATKNSVYTYDALDRPTREAITRQGAPDDTSTLSYLGLSDELTNEQHNYSTGPAKTRDYSYDPFGNRIGLTYQRAGDPAKDFYYGNDPHGSVSLLLDDAGNAQASYGYTAYGSADAAVTKENSADGAGASDPNDPVNAYRYTNKRIDPASGSLDMGARRFSPDTGRFLQEDQLNDSLGDLGLSADPLTDNRYSLAGGNPTNFVETDGHRFAYDAYGNTTSGGKQRSGGAGAVARHVSTSLARSGGLQMPSDKAPAPGKSDSTLARWYTPLAHPTAATNQTCIGQRIGAAGCGAFGPNESQTFGSGAARFLLETYNAVAIAAMGIEGLPLPRAHIPEVGTGGAKAVESGAEEIGAAAGADLSTGAELGAAAGRAASMLGPGRGAVYGTRAHAAFESEVNALGRTDLTTEVSYRNGRVVPRATAGSVRLDVVEGSLTSPTAVYDLKTGSAALTARRIAQIRSHLPSGYRNIPIEEIRP